MGQHESGRASWLVTVGRLVAIAALAAVGTLLLGVGQASAHSALTSSTPTDGAVLEQAPATIDLVFNQSISKNFAEVAVLSTEGEPVQVSAPAVTGAQVSVKVQTALGSGAYTVNYRVVSADGHPITGQVAFSVAPSSSAPTASVPSATGVEPPPPAGTVTGVPATTSPSTGLHPGDDPEGKLADNWVVMVVIVLVVAGLGAIALLLVLHSRDDHDKDDHNKAVPPPAEPSATTPQPPASPTPDSDQPPKGDRSGHDGAEEG